MAIDERLDLQTFKGQRTAVQDLFIKPVENPAMKKPTKSITPNGPFPRLIKPQ